MQGLYTVSTQQNLMLQTSENKAAFAKIFPEEKKEFYESVQWEGKKDKDLGYNS